MCKTFGERVKKLREDRLQNCNKKEWSLDALAYRIGVSSQSLSNIETLKTQNPNMNIIKNLAIEFGVSTDYLILGCDLNSHLILEITGDYKYLSNIKTKLTSTSTKNSNERKDISDDI